MKYNYNIDDVCIRDKYIYRHIYICQSHMMSKNVLYLFFNIRRIFVAEQKTKKK